MLRTEARGHKSWRTQLFKTLNHFVSWGPSRSDWSGIGRSFALSLCHINTYTHPSNQFSSAEPLPHFLSFVASFVDDPGCHEWKILLYMKTLSCRDFRGTFILFIFKSSSLFHLDFLLIKIASIVDFWRKENVVQASALASLYIPSFSGVDIAVVTVMKFLFSEKGFKTFFMGGRNMLEIVSELDPSLTADCSS